MANIIIPDQERRSLADRIARGYGVDTGDPAMREAAEVSAARTNEALKMADERRRYYYR